MYGPGREIGTAKQLLYSVTGGCSNIENPVKIFFRSSLESHYECSSSQHCAFLIVSVLAIFLMSLHVSEVDLFV
jgi:hypothetical protein